MVFLSDNGLAGGWGTALCRDTACIMTKPLFAWLLLVSASLCIVLIENKLRPGQSWPWSPRLQAPCSQSALSLFMSPHCHALYHLPEVFGKHFPLFPLSRSLSPPFLMIGCFILGVFWMTRRQLGSDLICHGATLILCLPHMLKAWRAG